MARQERMRYTGSSVWQKVDVFTGEIVEQRAVDEFERPIGRHEHFMITYLAEIISLIDSLGNQKMKVVKYILKEMEKSNNTLLITTRELSRRSGVGFNTVIETLKILDNAGIIQRKTGAIMVNPRLMNNKRASGEAAMLVKYRQFSDDLSDDLEDEYNVM